MIYLPKGTIMQWEDPSASNLILYPTEHNRAALSVDFESIENKQRMVNGTMRKWHIATKRTWSTSWTDVPHSKEFTVDGKMGGEEMEGFYLARQFDGLPFTVNIISGDGSKEVAMVMFSEFSKSVKKRGRYDFWDVDLSIEEV